MKRDNFSGTFGVLVALAGSAIGLGNLWRFPYLVGTNGGAAFILIYLLFVFVLCLPILISEFLVGRRSQSNAVRAFTTLAPKSKWGIVGVLGVLGAIAILSFYSVVGGWTLNYAVKAISMDLLHTSEQVTDTFNSMVTSPFEPVIYMFLFLLLTAGVIIGGIKNGIERFSKIMMPILFVMIVMIAVRSVTLPGAGAGIEFLFKPDFSKVTFETLLVALGQAFFSLSIGCGAVLTYASYVKKSENIVKTSALTAFSDAIFAMIAGLAVMPAVFAFGVSPTEGPGLVFIILPEIFEQLPAGGFIAILFFFILLIAAVTSSISLMEVIVTYIIEEFRLSRKIAILVTLFIATILGTLCSLSQGVLSQIRIFGLNIFDFFDSLSANVLMTLGGLLLVLFVGWKLKKEDFMDEISNSGTLNHKILYGAIYFLIRYIAPIVILTIMIFGLI
ncbi:MAG: sodium-dependent transporter [Bacteroidales bacterium]|nr:sodium-dependent transporter [Bacteroidales bacterium]